MFPRTTFTKPAVFMPILIVKSRPAAFSHFFLNKTTQHKFDFCNKFRVCGFGIIDFSESTGKFIYLFG